MFTQDEIGRRKPVWLALSELWLDTELETNDLERIAHLLKRSGFSISELRHIYLEEVAPVLYPTCFLRRESGRVSRKNGFSRQSWTKFNARGRFGV